MPTTTRLVLAQRLSEAIGDYYSDTADTNGTNTTLVDTSLADLTESDDGIQGWVEPTSGSNDAVIRRIKGSGGYTASTQTITVNAAWGNSLASGDAYILHKIHPDDKYNAINRAIEALSPRVLYVSLLDESIHVDNILTNPGFEDAATITGWATAGAGSSGVESVRVFHGARAATMTGVETLTQTPTINIAEVLDKNVLFSMWVYATAADSARLRIDWDGGTTFTNSDFHTGANEWQRLEVQDKPPASATQVSVILDAPVSGNVVKFDGPGGLFIDAIARYTLPSTFIKGVNYVKELSIESAAQDGNYYEIHPQGRPTRGRILQITGAGILSTVATATDVTEVGDAHVNLIVYKAAEMLYGILAGRATGDDRADFEKDEVKWGLRAEREENKPGVRMRPMSAELNPAWHVERDSSGAYLVFDRVTSTGSLGF